MTTDTDKVTMQRLRADLIEELNNNKADILDQPYAEDVVSEYADGMIPVYNYDLMMVAADDLWLACRTPESGVPDDASPVSLMQAIIYEELSETARDWLQEAQDAADEEE